MALTRPARIALLSTVGLVVSGCSTSLETEEPTARPAPMSDSLLIDATTDNSERPAAGLVGQPRWLDDDTIVWTEPAAGDAGATGLVVAQGVDGTRRTELGEGRAPVPSPNGELVAFEAADGRLRLSEVGTPRVIDTDVDVATVSRLAASLEAGVVTWSPDGTLVAAVEMGAESSDLVVIDARSGRETSRWTHSGLVLSPVFISNDEIAFRSTDMAGEDSHVALWSIDSGDTRQIGPDLGTTIPASLAWSETARRLIAVDNLLAAPTYQMGLISIDPTTGAAEPISDTGFIWDDAPEVTRGSELVYGTRSIALPDAIRSIDLVTGERRSFELDRLSFASAVSANPSGTRVAWVAEDLDGTVAVRFAELGDGEQLRPSTVATIREAYGSFDDIAVEQISWTTSDGVTVGGLLFTPKHVSTTPLWVDVHGGPEGGIGTDGALLTSTPLEWFWLASHGWTVLVADYRSSGIARLDARLEADRPLALTELNDVVDGVRSVLSTGRIDRDRIVLAGHSAGGGVAQWAATNSSMFSAIIAKESAGEIPPLSASPDDPTLRWLWGTDPDAAEADYRAFSPMNTGHRRTAPILFLAGDIPGDGSAAEVEPVYEQLRATSDVPARLEIFSGEGHVFTDPGSWRRLLDVVREFALDQPS